MTSLEDQIEDIVRSQECSINIIYQRHSIKERLLLAYEQMSFTLKKVFWYILIGVALEQLGRDNKVEHITDIAHIAALGVLTSPALMIGTNVVSSGRL